MTNAVGSYRVFLDAAVEIAGSDAASVQVFDEAQGGLRLAGWRGFHPASARFWRLVVPESASTCGMALVTGERVVVGDVGADEALAGSEDLFEYRRSRLAAVQSTPLLTDDGRFVGMISTHWHRPHEPSTAELQRIDALARRCASAVARVQESPGAWQTVGSHLLHEVNQRIHELAAGFDQLASDGARQEYLCECGCGEWLALTGSEFEVKIAAQEPLTAEGHMVAPTLT